MTKNLGNTMRIHIPSCSYSDPRYAEYGDQLGIMYIWVSTGWNRKEWTEDGKGWTGPRKNLKQQIDEYITDIKQVRNHPSIIVWELFNEGVKKRKNELLDAFYPTMHKTDPSRFIKPVKNHFREEPMLIKSIHITSLGYGGKWTKLGNWADKGQKFLNDKNWGYFGVEFAEIAGQDNWNLVRCKPWYKHHSYEWGPRVFEVKGKINNKTVKLMINEDGYLIPPENTE